MNRVDQSQYVHTMQVCAIVPPITVVTAKGLSNLFIYLTQMRQQELTQNHK